MHLYRICLLVAMLLPVRLCAAAFVPQSLAHAVPAPLSAGDRFHLLFVTRDVRSADSMDIAAFNSFVNAAADSAGIGPGTAGISWFAVASTPNVDARDNAIVQAPVYNMQGELLASGFADLWDGALAAAVKYDEHAQAINSFHHVWTGSGADGRGKAGRELGQFAAIVIGDLTVSDGRWLDASGSHLLVDWHVYALSEPLVVVPEPSSLWVIGGGLIGVVVAGRSWRPRQGRGGLGPS